MNIRILKGIEQLYYKRNMMSLQRSHDRLATIGFTFFHGKSGSVFGKNGENSYSAGNRSEPTSCTVNRTIIKFLFSQYFVVETVSHWTAIIEVCFGSSSI